ncbi:MAG: hypothetical protein ACLQIB_32875 [Isosphaeraceae bacterium]
MYYCTFHPNDQYDRVRLYPDVGAAIAAAGGHRPVYEVAVSMEGDSRLVVASEVDPPESDLEWTTRAQLHADGSVTAKGTIPRELFVGYIYSPQCLARIQEPRHRECG